MKRVVALALFLIVASFGTAFAATENVDTAALLRIALETSADIDTIMLTGNITLNNTDNNFAVNRNVTIVGGGREINGTTFGMFDISSGTLTFDNVKLVTAVSSGNTAIEIIGGTAEFSNGTTFDYAGAGTGIGVTRGTAEFNSTAFSGNGTGEFVAVAGGTANFTSATFNGVGTRAVNVTNGNAVFTGTSFSGIQGGASVVNVSGGSATFDATTAFTGNLVPSVTVSGNGSAGFTGTEFTNHPASAQPVIDVSGGTATFSGGAFTGNAAQSVVIRSNGQASFDNVRFANASAAGASIVELRDNGTANFTGTTDFDGNGTRAFVMSGGTATFSGTRFLRNASGARIDGGRATFDGVAFTDNVTTTEDGGALSIALGADVTLNGNVSFERNGAVNGGALWVATGARLTVGGTLTFLNNTATEDGGAVWTGGTAFALKDDMLFRSNSAVRNGGAIYAGVALTVSGGTFETNSTTSATVDEGNGGAVYAVGSLRITGGTFTENTTTNHGGALYGEGTVSVTGGAFAGNEADENGGAIFATAQLTVEPADQSITFGGNTAGAYGGALYGGTNVILSRTIFRENEASSGGAVWAIQNGDVQDCWFEKNNADISAGALHAANATIDGSTFDENIARNNVAGAVYLSGTSESNITLSRFAKNNATALGGGALYVGGNRATVYISRCYFDENSATEGDGGAVHIIGAKSQIDRSTFSQNNIVGGAGGAVARGGAAYIDSTSFRLVNCTFVGNSTPSGGQGGGLYLGPNAGSDLLDKSVVFYCTFTDNVAGGGQGGGMATNASALDLAASLFVGNNANAGYEDVVRIETNVTSLGYNLIAKYGIVANGQFNGDVAWRADPSVVGLKVNDMNGSAYVRNIIFGTNGLADNVPEGLTAITTGSSLATTPRKAIQTVALINTTEQSVNPAVDKINGTDMTKTFNSYFARMTHADARGVTRAAYSPKPAGGILCDIGAYEIVDPSDGPGPDPDPGGLIAYVRMSGIPNNMASVGQTCSLTATATYQNGNTSITEEVVWTSSNPSVARIDNYGNLVSLRRGTTDITVTTVRTGTDGERKSHTVQMKVDRDESYSNIHPDLWNKLTNYYAAVDGAHLYFVDANPSEVESSSFAGAFRSAYGVDPKQLTEISGDNNVDFKSSRAYRAATLSAVRPSAGISLETLAEAGAVLPLKFVYNVDWDVVSDILGTETTFIGDADLPVLARSLRFVLADETGARVTMIDDGSEGVSASAAFSSGALAYQNAGTLALSVSLYLADAESATKQAHLMDGKLVVADNDANGRIDGEVWLLRSDSGGNNPNPGPDSSGGGGGCNGGLAPLATLLCACGALLAARRHARGIKG